MSIEEKVSITISISKIYRDRLRTMAAKQNFEPQLMQIRAALQAAHIGKPPSSIPGLAPARQLYRAFGLDPTRTRPSSEALLRRVCRGKPVPRISGPVDLCNLLSLRFLLPLNTTDEELEAGLTMLEKAMRRVADECGLPC